MKIYLLLLTDIANIDKYVAKSPIIVNNYPLYAVTDNKKYLKKFISTRDMSKFKLITEVVDDEDEYTKFINKYELSHYELTNSSFPTTGEVNGYYTIQYVSVVCTIKESDSVEYDYDEYIINKIEDLVMNIENLMENKEGNIGANIDVFYVVDNIKRFISLFNDDIISALEYLDFESFIEDCMYQLDNLDSSEFSLWEDKLRVFCNLYKNTFR